MNPTSRPTFLDYSNWLFNEPSTVQAPSHARGALADFLSTHSVILYPPLPDTPAPMQLEMPDLDLPSTPSKTVVISYFFQTDAMKTTALANAKKTDRDAMDAFAITTRAKTEQLSDYHTSVMKNAEHTERTDLTEKARVKAWAQFKEVMPAFFKMHCEEPKYRFMDLKYSFAQTFSQNECTSPGERFKEIAITLQKVQLVNTKEERVAFLKSLGFAETHEHFEPLCEFMCGRLCLSKDEKDNNAFFSLLAHEYLEENFEPRSVSNTACTSVQNFDTLLKGCKQKKEALVDELCTKLNLTPEKGDAAWGGLLLSFKNSLESTIEKIAPTGTLTDIPAYNAKVIAFLKQRTITATQSDCPLDLYALTRPRAAKPELAVEPAPVLNQATTPAPSATTHKKPNGLFSALFGGCACQAPPLTSSTFKPIAVVKK